MPPRNADQIVQAGAGGPGAHLGDVVFLRLWQATCARSRLETIATSAGFPVDLLPPGMGAEQAFQHALRSARVDGYMLRPISKDDRAIVWGAVREDADAVNNDLDYNLESRIALLRANEAIVYEVPDHPACHEVAGRFATLNGSVTTEQIRAMVKRVCKGRSGIPIGSDFFVPGTHAELLRAMKQVVEALGASQLWLLPIHDTAESRETIDRASRASLEDDLKALAQEIQEFDANTRGATMERRFERFAEIKQRASLYAGMLQVAHNDLLSNLDGMETRVRELIGVADRTEENNNG